METNNLQQSRRAPARRALSAALEELEVTWLRRIQEEKIRLSKVFQDSEGRLIKRSQKEEARLDRDFEDKKESIDKEYPVLFRDFEAHKERQKAKTKELVLQNRTLWVRLSLLCLSTGFLIFQQKAALEANTERMKLERKYNVRGALGK